MCLEQVPVKFVLILFNFKYEIALQGGLNLLIKTLNSDVNYYIYMYCLH